MHDGIFQHFPNGPIKQGSFGLEDAGRIRRPLKLNLHSAGCVLAARLSEVTGGGEAYRCGGEEFSILFPHRSAADAALHLERLRQSIEYSPFTVRGPDRSRRQRPERRYAKPTGKTLRSDVTVTVSIGVAEPTAALPSIEHVLHAADKALYRAKDAGRNRVEVWKPQPRRVPSDAEPVRLR
jgi:GGDEF domain-containing protein